MMGKRKKRGSKVGDMCPRTPTSYGPGNVLISFIQCIIKYCLLVNSTIFYKASCDCQIQNVRFTIFLFFICENVTYQQFYGMNY